MTDFSYVGINADGKIAAICIDDPKHKKSTAEFVAEWIAIGRIVERMEHGAAMARIKAERPESFKKADAESTCSRCNGTGEILCEQAYHGERSEFWKERCPVCNGAKKSATATD